MKTTLSQIGQWVPGSRITADTVFEGVSTDSRHVKPGNLFIALKGENFDAHRFLKELVDKKVAAVLVERVPENYPLPAMIVPDTRLAMGQIAQNWRNGFRIPVVGVTGSNGKTTVKEMIASVFKAAFGEENCLATAGNFNNDIGVPLTVFRLNEMHKAAVIELGMNHMGEMACLAAIAQPTVGLVNNAQREHQEFLRSVEAVAKENGTVIRMLPENGIAVFPADDIYSSLWAGYAGGRQTITFGFSKDADVTATYGIRKGKTCVVMTLAGEPVEMTLSTSGQHNVRNAMAAAACCLAAGIGKLEIAEGLEKFVPVRGRLERKTAFNGALLIDDTYNANPDSVRAAIDVLADIPADGIFVLGDMGEVGDEGERFHAEIGAYARERRINHFFTFGEMARFASEAYGKGARHFMDLEEMNGVLKELTEPEMTILVKGSRFMKMERVVEKLMNEMNREGR